MKTSEIIVFIVYLLCMLGIGIFFFVKNRNGGEKTYFLGGREMGPWVAALSAGASDMECMGAHGTSYFYLCTGLRPGMDSCGTCNRLHYKLAVRGTATT